MAERLMVLNPSGEVRTARRTLAPRLPSLQSKTLGIVDDCIGASGDLLKRVGEVLVEQYGVAKVMYRQKPNLASPTPESTFNELKQSVDFVVVGIGG